MEDVRNYYSRVSEEYARNQSFSEMPDPAEEDLKNLLDTFLNSIDGERVLDAGCGPGRDTEYMKNRGYDAVGVDSAEGMIETATEHGDADYSHMDIRNLDFQDSSFSGVWCNTVMQFMDSEGKRKAISEISRVLEKDGVLYSTFKLGTGKTERDDGLERHLEDRDEILRLLRKARLEPKDQWTFQLNGMDVLGVFCRRR